MTFGIVQHLRSQKAGARPGDGTVRSLLGRRDLRESARRRAVHARRHRRDADLLLPRCRWNGRLRRDPSDYATDDVRRALEFGRFPSDFPASGIVA